VIEPPFCRPPVTPLSVPVTEPRPVLDPVLEPLLLLLPSLLKPVLAGALLPNEPDVFATPGAAPAALPRAGMKPETEFKPGRLLLAGLLACIGPLAWIMLLPVVDEDEDEVPQDAPMTLGAAATPDKGRARPQRTPLAELSPLSETGASCACASVGAATPSVRMAAESAPPSKFASYIRSTPFRWDNSGEYDSAGEIDRKAYGGPFGGNQTPAGRTERPVCAPDTVTQL